ncbi:hypothetical protein Zmor_021888 [Zophobas morio]|uniref:Uncharacterized protein n=1 Tax=Zophobas morio TaxID=2755281 RepID=A0AA38I6X5_9CUCU|nr:hypothetical protein Zmor_021888 [Zophobas morio]
MKSARYLPKARSLEHRCHAEPRQSRNWFSHKSLTGGNAPVRRTRGVSVKMSWKRCSLVSGLNTRWIAYKTASWVVHARNTTVCYQLNKSASSPAGSAPRRPAQMDLE